MFNNLNANNPVIFTSPSQSFKSPIRYESRKLKQSHFEDDDITPLQNNNDKNKIKEKQIIPPQPTKITTYPNISKWKLKEEDDFQEETYTIDNQKITIITDKHDHQTDPDISTIINLQPHQNLHLLKNTLSISTPSYFQQLTEFFYPNTTLSNQIILHIQQTIEENIKNTHIIHQMKQGLNNLKITYPDNTIEIDKIIEIINSNE